MVEPGGDFARLPRMTVTVTSELQGTIVSILVDVGAPVRSGTVLALIESMKMHHEVVSPSDGTVTSIEVSEGATVMAGDAVVSVSAGAVETTPVGTVAATGSDGPAAVSYTHLRAHETNDLISDAVFGV